jgi:hypothetical protein
MSGAAKSRTSNFLFLARAEPNLILINVTPNRGSENAKNTQDRPNGVASAIVGAVVLTVSVAGVPGVTEPGVTEHCGANCGDGDTEQVSETELLKLPTAVTSMLEVADCPGLTVSGESVDVETEKS